MAETVIRFIQPHAGAIGSGSIRRVAGAPSTRQSAYHGQA
jgi:hypothetical protein